MGFIARLLLPFVLWGTFIDETISFDPSKVKIVENNGYTFVEVEGGFPYVIPGAPELPVVPIQFLIPYNKTVDRFEILGHEEEILKVGASIKPYNYPGAPPYVEERSAEPNPDYYSLDRYPHKFLQYRGTGTARGYRIASFLFYPVQYEPSSGKLILIHNFKVRLYLKDTTSFYPKRTLFSDFELYREIVKGLVKNGDKVDIYAPPTMPERVEGKLEISEEPSLSGSPVSYLIIIPDEFASNYEELQNIKDKLGYPATIKTTSYIYSHYQGLDEAERIRNFIKDAYENWGIEWVLIGSDVPLIPTRKVYSPVYGQPAYFDTVVTDFYFACLDGNWNEDGDEVMGEVEDNVDFYPDVFIGRLTFTETNEISNYISKLETYIYNPGNGNFEYVNKFLFWGADQNQQGDGCNQAQTVSLHVPSSVVKSIVCEDSTYSPTIQEFMDSLNSGFGNVFVTAHGNPNYFQICHTPSQNFYYGYANEITSPPFFLDVISCDVAAFDLDCITEHILEAEGGAIGVFATTRLNYPGVALSYVCTRLDTFYIGNVTESGAMVAKTLMTFAPLASSFYGINRYLNLSYVLLGDPSLSIYTSTPYNLLVELPDSIIVGENLVKVSVFNTATGTPVIGAKVVAYKENEFYTLSYTDITGRAFIHLKPETPGVVKFYVYTCGAIPFEGEKEVIPLESHLYVSSYSVLDYGGDGDGIAEAGETFSLRMVVKNGGRRRSPASMIILETEDENVHINDNVAYLSPIYYMDSTIVTGFNVNVLTDAEDSSTCTFKLIFLESIDIHAPVDTLIVSQSGDTISIDTITLILRAPQIDRLYNITYENGDTVITKVLVKNNGGDCSRALRIILSSLSEAVALDSVIECETIPPGGKLDETYPDSLIVLLNGNSLDTQNFLLTIKDSLKTYFNDTIKLRIPTPPQLITPTPGYNSIYLNIRGSSDPLLLGYMLTRSTSENGDYELITSSPLTGLWHRDINLDPFTKYYYKVAAVDSFLNISDFTTPVSGLTNPPLYPNWPKYSSEAQTSSPLIADIDPEYPGYEIVITGTFSGMMIAYHSDGSKLEGWPLYIGGTGTRAYASAATGDINGDGKLEVVASALGEDNKVYAYTSEGELVDGWPVELESNGYGIYASPVVFDLDGDGSDEILVITWRGNLYIFKGDGTGFNSEDGLFISLNSINNPGFSPPAVGDIDGDDLPEIAVGTESGGLFVFEVNGDTLPGFPVDLGGAIRSPLAIADFSPSYPGLEIACVAGTYLYIISKDGNILPGWPKYVSIPIESQFYAPAAADIDNDGTPELIVQGGDNLCAYNWDATPVPGFPASLEFYYSGPVVGDINGDGDLEIVVGDAHERLYSINSDGSISERFPIPLTGTPGTPTIADINGDGKMDIFVAASGRDLWGFYIPENEGSYRMEWPTFLHDPGRTACYENPIILSGGAFAGKISTPFKLALLGAQPSPFKNTTMIVFSLPKKSHVVLSIYDITGRRVKTLINGVLDEGIHKVMWDGKDKWNHPLPSGIYFYTLRTQGKFLKGKTILIR